MSIKEIVSRYKKRVFFLTVFITLGVVTSSVNPMIYGGIIDGITNTDKEKFKICLICFLLIQAVIQVFGLLETYIGQLTVTKIENEIKRNLFDRILRFKCSALDRYKEGELLNRLEFDAESIVDYYIDIVSNSILILCNFTISLLFIVNISGKLTVIAILVIPILYSINFLSRKRIRLLQEISKNFEDKYFSFLNETLRNLQNLKIFHVGKMYLHEYQELLKEKYGIEKKNVIFTGCISAIRSVVSNVFDALILYVSAMIIFHGGMTIGNMVAFNTYLAKLFEAIEKILEINMNRQSIAVNQERIDELYKEPIERIENNQRNFDGIKSIRLENVSFAYEKEYILKDINLSIDKPGIYAIKGENGSGKTTLLKLIDGLYQPDNGEIFMNNIPLRKWSLEEIRRQIAYLGKEPFLVNGTVMDNLCMGERISKEKVENACERIGVDKDIKRFEKSYDTEIGENGNKLSSGQKQKLALARVLLQKKSVILLDEALSALDIETKREINKVLQEMKQSKIVIFVSHESESVIEEGMKFTLKKV